MRALTLKRQSVKLQREARRDALIGLANRRHLDATLAEMMDSGSRGVIALIDIDHFKRINDTYSHQVGDAVLRHLAKLLHASFRRTGLATRYGGEEFCVLFDGADLARSTALCERLRMRVEQHDWGAVQAGLMVTISIGVAERQEAEDLPGWLALADERLYVAKRAGRNRVVAQKHVRSSFVA